MVSRFSSHPVTMEIEAGPNGRNMSNTLVGANERANLFGFIGFESGDNPIQIIKMYLAKNIRVRKIRTSKAKIIIDFSISIPSLEEVYELSPMPWAPGLSWAEGIERGIPGLGQYLVGTAPKGRSGGGIQTKVMLNAGSFKSVKYISKILQDLVNDILQRLK